MSANRTRLVSTRRAVLGLQRLRADLTRAVATAHSQNSLADHGAIYFVLKNTVLG